MSTRSTSGWQFYCLKLMEIALAQCAVHINIDYYIGWTVSHQKGSKIVSVSCKGHKAKIHFTTPFKPDANDPFNTVEKIVVSGESLDATCTVDYRLSDTATLGSELLFTQSPKPRMIRDYLYHMLEKMLGESVASSVLYSLQEYPVVTADHDGRMSFAYFPADSEMDTILFLWDATSMDGFTKAVFTSKRRMKRWVWYRPYEEGKGWPWKILRTQDLED